MGTLTIAQLAGYVGRRAVWRPKCFGEGQVHVFVKILNIKQGWDAPFFEIQPLAGTGTTWVKGTSLEMTDDTTT